MKNHSFRREQAFLSNPAPGSGAGQRRCRHADCGCRTLLVLTYLITALGFLGSSPARAGGVVTNCTEGALQMALIGGGLVTLSCDSSIALTEPIVIVADTVIDGSGHSPILAAGQITNLSHLLVVPPGVRVELRNVTLSGASAAGLAGTDGEDGEPVRGAAIFVNRGELVLDGCTLSGNRVVGGTGAAAVQRRASGGNGGHGTGGAIYNYGGKLTVTNTVFTGNSAEGGAGGEGAAGTLFGNGSSGGDGGDGGQGAGAAIFNTAGGILSILDSTFSSNRVAGGTAALGGLGAGTLAFAGEPGNSGAGLGAALFNEQGTITIVNSTFLGNAGQGAAGLAGDSGTVLLPAEEGSDGGRALGGGIFNSAGTVSLANCTLVRNKLTGGEGGVGGTGGNRTFGANGADGGDGGAALGAGLYNGSAGVTVVVNCSFSNNDVVGGAGGQGGPGTNSGSPGDEGSVGHANGAAVFNQGGTLRVRNSILAHSLSGSNAGGSITDEGFNLSSDATPTLAAAGSRNAVDPLYDSLILAGGHTLTLTLSSNSPAINAITGANRNGGPVFDQRNAYRLEPCDIGAFEFDGQFFAPALQAKAEGTRIVLTWPATGSLVLQTAEGLAATNPWTTITNPPVSSGSWRSLTLERTNRARFYRLTPE